MMGREETIIFLAKNPDKTLAVGNMINRNLINSWLNRGKLNFSIFSYQL